MSFGASSVSCSAMALSETAAPGMKNGSDLREQIRADLSG